MWVTSVRRTYIGQHLFCECGWSAFDNFTIQLVNFDLSCLEMWKCGGKTGNRHENEISGTSEQKYLTEQIGKKT